MRVTDTIWFTGMRGSVGLVMGVDDVTGDRKAYIGRCSGLDEELDTKVIVDYGVALKLDTIMKIATHLGGKKA